MNAAFGKIGATYEDLRYQSNPAPLLNPDSVASYKSLADFRLPHHGVPLVSFFSGCGGMDLGFEAACFTHCALIEKTRMFCDTVRYNRKWRVIGPPSHAGDITRRDCLSAQLEALGLAPNFAGVFIGGRRASRFRLRPTSAFLKAAIISSGRDLSMPPTATCCLITSGLSKNTVPLRF